MNIYTILEPRFWIAAVLGIIAILLWLFSANQIVAVTSTVLAIFYFLYWFAPSPPSRGM